MSASRTSADNPLGHILRGPDILKNTNGMFRPAKFNKPQGLDKANCDLSSMEEGLGFEVLCVLGKRKAHAGRPLTRRRSSQVDIFIGDLKLRMVVEEVTIINTEWILLKILLTRKGS